MKKRLLALALCLVMVTSLLPITAAAYTEEDKLRWVGGIQNGGIYCGNTCITYDSPDGLPLRYVVVYNSNNNIILDHMFPTNGESGQLELEPRPEKFNVEFGFNSSSSDWTTLETVTYSNITINRDHNWSDWTSNGDGTHSRTCSNGCVDSPQIKPCADSNADHNCDVCNGCIHGWNFKAAGNTLTGHCPFCGKDVTLTLKADSVTLPNSPFNAWLEGWDQFRAAIPQADLGSFIYKYKGPGDSEFGNRLNAVPAEIKAGEYQVGVWIKYLPGTVEQESGEVNQNNEAYLWVKYTAADPAVTAQTGDDRPIEIMLVSALAFSALAAAAFILDSKRKYRQ